ncbi:MAG: Mut7-C RNAse domain-containing protein [Gemmatimonadetes bacterium]|nr:Mut7-C RNAse domain-containing protein [Gemmatimonadota bacterium]
MSIPCPNCGREYDVTLFQFGRSIHCTCGTRVGLEVKLAPRRRARDERSFFADAMLGRLARWLRAVGYDTAYDARIEDVELVRRAVEERRTILTRDRGLPVEWWVDDYLLVESETPLEQLAQVVRHFGLDWSGRLFMRCLVCNTPLEEMAPEQARIQVPPRIAEGRKSFARCPSCGRIYWEGSHTARMRRRLERTLGGS